MKSPPRAPLALLVAALLASGCSQESGAVTRSADQAKSADPTTTSVQQAAAKVPAGPPDLSHVKVGQRYRFELEQSDTKMHMVWVVTAVAKFEVRYTVSVLKNGAVLSAPTETSWTVTPPSEHEHAAEPPTKTKPGVTTTFETLALAGRDWSCRVTTSGDVKTWTALANGAPTFPPLLKQTTGLVVSSVLLEIDG